MRVVTNCSSLGALLLTPKFSQQALSCSQPRSLVGISYSRPQDSSRPLTWSPTVAIFSYGKPKAGESCASDCLTSPPPRWHSGVAAAWPLTALASTGRAKFRSEEHTSELQSPYV